ncbi:CYFA0S08e04786g1_1 [Cyberlindnera fabianii]|uniref:Sulfhydryl oxidase n=1 Tax=Cyberlindnera fabianii TaxID=36022 RepID=A0A061AXC1_CYBFA|nr:CYFA0S08e04786g1_1 [Cyberlindnera fabianii]
MYLLITIYHTLSYSKEDVMRYTRKPLESLLFAVLILGGLYYFLNSTAELQDPKPLSPHATSSTSPSSQPGVPKAKVQDPITPEEVLNNDSGLQKDAQTTDGFVEIPFMPKMTNETLKAELGNAAWKLFHTILARYPEKPSQQERDTLTQYIYLFAKVYPCGDCARHFNQLLKKFPPQTSSRQTAAVWGCHLHNQVNERLGHPLYDCTHIIDDYDCGCGEDEAAEGGVVGSADDVNVDKEHLKFDLETEGKQLG